MHRFFVIPSEITDQWFASDAHELCHQFFRVLKLKISEQVILCDNTEHEYIVELTRLGKSEAGGKILEKKNKPDISSISKLHLFVPPLKNPSRWEWMVEKCTEIGVASFTPLITERTEVTSLRKIDRLERIIKEAAELSGRTKLPVIHEPVEFKKMIDEPQKRDESVNLIATLVLNGYAVCGANRNDIENRIKANETKNYKIFIGPVGDFTEQEVNLAIQRGFQPLSLGSQILRTETAAVVASALMMT